MEVKSNVSPPTPYPIPPRDMESFKMVSRTLKRRKKTRAKTKRGRMRRRR